MSEREDPHLERSHIKEVTSKYQEKPGAVVERVKDELHKTIEAKRKLLERNFIHFRFDEYKNPKE